AEGLAHVTFHNKLGSQKDRIDRIAALAREIAPLVEADEDMAEQAALIAKADLQSAMVGEFPELQGTMGMYYAREAGLQEAIAYACRAHYQPLGPSDRVPAAPTAIAVALADKIDTLTGFWAIDEKPTGSKDPFALRRAALGVIRLVLGNGLRLGLLPRFEGLIARQFQYFSGRDARSIPDAVPGVSDDFLAEAKLRAEGRVVPDDPETGEAALGRYEAVIKGRSADLLAFFHDRLKVYLKDQGIRHDVIDACLAMQGNDDLTLLVKRAEALGAFLQTDDGGNLIQGFKRANNIITQAEEKDGVEYSYGADVKFAEEQAERTLFAALDTAEAAITPAMTAEEFGAAMTAMASLRAPIDAFFEAVQVNSDNEIVRRNRLNLLSRIRQICLSVADLNKIEG
ncbi:MAG: glycine--tRNA ligase subunit beta, partial [Albidovulum sp.]